MEFFNAVRGVSTIFPSLANCPKVLVAAKVVQPVVVTCLAVAAWTQKGTSSDDEGKLCERFTLAGISAYMLSTIALTVASFFQVPLWTKGVLVIFSSVSFELVSFFAGKFIEVSKSKTGNSSERIANKPDLTPVNILWLTVGTISSIVMSLSVGGIIAFNPFVLGAAAVGLVLETTIKYGDAYCQDESGKLNLTIRTAIITIGDALIEMALVLLYVNPFMGTALPRFVSLLPLFPLALNLVSKVALAFLEDKKNHDFAI